MSLPLSSDHKVPAASAHLLSSRGPAQRESHPPHRPRGARQPASASSVKPFFPSPITSLDCATLDKAACGASAGGLWRKHTTDSPPKVSCSTKLSGCFYHLPPHLGPILKGRENAGSGNMVSFLSFIEFLGTLAYKNALCFRGPDVALNQVKEDR